MKIDQQIKSIQAVYSMTDISHAEMLLIIHLLDEAKNLREDLCYLNRRTIYEEEEQKIKEYMYLKKRIKESCEGL